MKSSNLQKLEAILTSDQPLTGFSKDASFRLPDQTITEITDALRKHGTTISVGNHPDCEHLRALRAAGALVEANGASPLKLGSQKNLTILIGEDVIFSKKPISMGID